MAAAAQARGDAEKAKGNAALARKLIFGFGKTAKYQDAADCFKNAANAYKLGNMWQSAGDCFKLHAQALEQVGDCDSDIVNAFVEAGNAYKKVNPVDAIQAFDHACNLYNDKGRFQMSARYYKEIAEIYESDSNEEGAMEYYQKAADLYFGDDKKSAAQQCLLKIAGMSASKEDFSKASEIYESIGKASMESRLSSFSAKGHLFNCLICHLAAGDTVAVNIKLGEFKMVDHSLASSRECKLIESLVKAIEESNPDDFQDACGEYDRISPIEPWKITLLLKAKRQIPSADGDGESDVPDLS